jgi:hypothetical protein
MSVVEPPVSQGQPGRPDDLDTLLRSFFQAELPSPWPDLHLPEKDAPRLVPAAPARWAPVSSRLALAASVGLLLSGTLLMPSGPVGDATDTDRGEHIGMRDRDPAPVVPEVERRESLKQEKDKPTEYLIELFERR